MVSLCSCLKFSSVDTVSYSQLESGVTVSYDREGGVVLFVVKVQFS